MNDDEFLKYGLDMDINGVRMMYDHLCYAIETWPGSPRRPPEEQEYLKDLKMKMFMMMAEHSFNNQ